MNKRRKSLVPVCLAVLVAAMALTGCESIFGKKDDSSNLYDAGWDSASMPRDLIGNWQQNDFYFLKVASNKFFLDNREWSIETISRNSDGDYRIVGRSNIQYRAMYFRKIRETSAEYAIGSIAFSLFDAKMAPRDNWTEMSN